MLRTENLTVNRNDNSLIQNITLQIPQGGLCAVIGKNGAGKTTLLRALAGVTKDHQGAIYIAHKTLNSFSQFDLAKSITWIPERMEIPFAFTAYEVVTYSRYPWHQGFPTRDDQIRVNEALEQVGLANKKSQTISSMSSGEQRKVMLARAAASDSEIIILDEPFANLDPLAQIENIKILRHLTESNLFRKTIIASMHEIHLAHEFASYCIVLKDSLKIASGKTSSIMTSNILEQAFGVQSEVVFNKQGQPKLIMSELPASVVNPSSVTRNSDAVYLIDPFQP